MLQVLDALQHSHEIGIIHRDLKPQNIMVSHTASRLHIKILDFGIGALTKENQYVNYEELTLNEEVIGTPNYSAPEQLRGEPATEQSDIYAWGLIFIECMTAQSVIQGKTVAEIFQKQLMVNDCLLYTSPSPRD